MRQFKVRIRAILSYTLTLLLIGGYPAATFALTSPDTTATTSTTSPPPEPKPVYTYDTATGRWNTDSWKYDATSGQYAPVSQPGPISPTGPTTAPGVPEAVLPTETSGTDTSSANPTSGTALTSTTDAPSSSTTNSANATSNTDIKTNNTIGNTVSSDAKSGDTAVTSNTAAGNAASGNASATETVMNMINSSVVSGAGGVANFVADVTGNVYGDIMLYPMMLMAMLSQAVQNPTSTNQQSVNSAVNVDTNNKITNDINLNATSGGATVAGNTKAGNATTGTANAVADVMNIINSIVAANQSFIGTINIYGDLNGDILIAPDFIPQLLASNNGSTVSNTTDASLNVKLNDNQSIANNINLGAASGSATVAGNTKAGNATTGTADTNLVILNLTGHEVVASNSMLVFVNVLGKWIGVIVDAPAGATAAAIGSGVDQNNTTNIDSTVSAQTDTQITNNITLAAQSGDAAVTRNTSAGNAISGNATASANILNMSQSSFGLSGWFGVLFINVFGSWLGSFGIDTDYGNAQPVAQPAGSGTFSPIDAQSLRAVQFIDKTPQGGDLSTRRTSNTLAAIDMHNIPSQPVGIDSGTPPSALKASASVPTSGTSSSSQYNDLPVTAAAVMGVLVLLSVTIRNLWPVVARRFGVLAS